MKLTSTQEAMLLGWLWILTGVYNWAVKKIELDSKDGIFYSLIEFQNLLAGHSKRMGVYSQVIQGTLTTVWRAWDRCFKKVGRKPHLKSKRRKLTSIPFPAPIRHPEKNRVKLPSLGSVKFHKQDIPEGKIKCGRIIRKASGWYLCLFIDVKREEIIPTGDGEVGIDPGFKDLLTLSTGEKIEHPRELEASAKRLAQAQRGKRKKLSARIQERIANQKKDRNHKLSLRLVKENKLIVFSKDNIKGLAHVNGKSVASSNHYQLRQFTSYKMDSRAGGGEYCEVSGRFSTMTCSACGSREGPTGLAGLSVRFWTCDCGAEHDRDQNSAVYTLNLGRDSASKAS